MFPSNFKPNGLFDLTRLGGNHDGGYLIEKTSIKNSNSLLSMGIGKNWKFEEDFVSANTVPTHAYDHTVTGTFWLKFFIKGFLSVLIGKANGPSDAIKTYHSFKRFFNDKATHYKSKLGIDRAAILI